MPPVCLIHSSTGLRGLTKKHKGVVETKVTKVKVKAGKSALTKLRPRRRFVKKLGTAKVVLVEQTLTTATAPARTTYRRLLLR